MNEDSMYREMEQGGKSSLHANFHVAGTNMV